MRKNKKKELTGKIISDKMDKTRVVEVERRERHKLYKKVIRKLSKFKAHDEKNETKMGDVIKMEETRPISKEKRWRVKEVIERSKI